MHTDRNTDKCINALFSFFLPFSAKKYPLPSLRADILSQSLVDSLGRGNFGIVVQVAVKICRYVVGGVSEPLLDLLHGNSACQKQAGTGMAQVMEADLFEVMLFDHMSEMVGNIVGGYQITHVVKANVVKIIPVVPLGDQAAVILLLALFLKKKLLDVRYQRKHSCA